MIPDYQTLMRPVLECAASGEISIHDVARQLILKFKLTEEEATELIASGKKTRFSNNVQWAKTYLNKAELIKITKPAYFIITELGKQALSNKKIIINNQYLKQFSKFQDFIKKDKKILHDNSKSTSHYNNENTIINTPDEILRDAYQTLNDTLAEELLSTIRNCSPTFFERLIVDLLLAMGYGGTSEDAGRVLGRSGDNGVDGVIDQDILGIDQVYIQAKRYKEDNAISSENINSFYGALSRKRANKGVFVTTSRFTADAIKAAQELEKRIVLIDGHQLAKLMIRYNIGCRNQEVIYIKKIDDDYFNEE